MTLTPPPAKPRKGPAFAFALIVAACCAALLPSEGRRLTPYQDSAKVWTVCMGITGAPVFAHPGVAFTVPECEDLERAYVGRMVGAMTRCIAPEVIESITFKEWIAYSHWSYNVGTYAFCHSTVSAHLNAGNHAGACKAMGRWTWITKPGIGKVNCRDPKQKCGGLPKRRDLEVAMCLEAIK